MGSNARAPGSIIQYRPMGGSAAGKVAVGQAAEWPCVTDFSGLYPSTGSVV